MALSVLELTSAIASGDSEALALLYRQRFDGLYAEARRCTGRDEAFSLDVVQDVMLKVIRSMKPLQNESQLIAWLRTVLHRCAYDRLRAERRLKVREAKVSASSAEEIVAPRDNEHLNWLAGQLNILSDEQRHLFKLRFGLGWTLSQIGAAIGLRPGAVDGRLNRALSAMRHAALEDQHE